MDQRELDHLNGKHVVVEYVYSGGKGARFLLQDLPVESDARELWRDIAFSNGPPLVEIRMRWDEETAKELRQWRADAQQESAPPPEQSGR